ncbi:MAG: two-component sensor histidine kinase [Cyanomargarita calcarea GSE-NOS-MK-12-04C]|jgi:signal transduction histidine kinase|uniref:Circadian input-output histidine kinase CikA n=1 Tax=Cyanomargarita calcarea GSE-NOS-MK-12-04C TaxID=2839659 RepID=A0A951UUH7_9CYAN|nr:two-component sensor histidine kinase [Cyanomargarita calcarea GSE-NOS-MK-12-04C]
MAKYRQSSFRRILVTRILLLFVPVLLVGEILALNKARSSLLETARANLTESAILKGEKILDAIAMVKTNLLYASKTQVLQTGLPPQLQDFLTQLAGQLPKQVECIQLKNPQNGDIVASTCGNQVIGKLKLPLMGDEVEVQTVLPPKAGITGKRDGQNQLRLLLSAPVYDNAGQLRYALSVQSVFSRAMQEKPGSLKGATVVIAEDGTILAHPYEDRVGSNIRQQTDASQLQTILTSAMFGRQDSVYLHFKEGKELIAGYSAIPSPITKERQQKLIILAVTSLDNALLGLEEIKLILIVLTVGLIGASLLTSLYLAPYLARPIEKLRDYALNLHLTQLTEPAPHDFQIREFNQLAQALDQMVERLKAWAEELEIAWKDAKSANQTKSHFVATTSHELRNPLNAIINCIRVVREELCDTREEEMEFLTRAEEAAIHLLGIINDLLDISKMEAGKLSVAIELIDLGKLLKDVINLQSVNVQQKGLQLVCEQLIEQIPVNADAGKLKQVLINIIGNAIKFTEEGSITITTKIESIDDKSVIIVSVKDTGVGVDSAQQDKLFRPFVMVDAQNTRKFGGTGLGLAISRNLMELMGGTITLESAGINQGTTVSIILPLIETSLLFPPEESQEGEEKEKRTQNKNSFNTFPVSSPSRVISSSSSASLNPRVFFSSDD